MNYLSPKKKDSLYVHIWEDLQNTLFGEKRLWNNIFDALCTLRREMFIYMFACMKESLKGTSGLGNLRKEIILTLGKKEEYEVVHAVTNNLFKKDKLSCLFWAVLSLCWCSGCLAAVSGSCSGCHEQAFHCSGFSCCEHRLWGVRASVVVAHGFSCSTAYGIFLFEGLNPCPLHWQADS